MTKQYSCHDQAQFNRMYHCNVGFQRGQTGPLDFRNAQPRVSKMQRLMRSLHRQVLAVFMIVDLDKCMFITSLSIMRSCDGPQSVENCLTHWNFYVEKHQVNLKRENVDHKINVNQETQYFMVLCHPALHQCYQLAKLINVIK